jgi:hypothetical protein
MDMARWRSGRRNIDELNAWQKADEFSMLLHDMQQFPEVDKPQ